MSPAGSSKGECGSARHEGSPAGSHGKDWAAPVDGPSVLAPARSSRSGARLVYLMGPSGSGKDTLLRLLRAGLHESEPVWIARRYITRPGSADEGSLQLSETLFDRMAQAGGFALYWHSHGLRYGIGAELDHRLRSGQVAVVNGSRRHLAVARARYPELAAVQVVVNPAVLAERLAQRGREDAVQIERRLADAVLPIEASSNQGGGSVHRLDNNGAPEAAAAELLALVRGLAGG